MRDHQPGSTQSFRAVLFDAGNTLVFFDGDRVRSVFDRLGIPFSSERFQGAELAARLHLTRSVEAGEHGTESGRWSEYFARVLRGVGLPEAWMERVGQALREEHRREHLWTGVDPAIRVALTRLRGAGLRLGVVSNADGRMASVLEAAGFGDLLDVVVDSEIAGVAKPDPRIFQLALQEIGVEPAAALYVGDLYHVDVVGARAAGMRAILLDPWGSLDHPVLTIPSVTDLPRLIAGVTENDGV